MARRRRSRARRAVTRARRSYRRGSSGSFNLQKLLVPVGVATFAEPIVDSYLKTLPIPSIGPVETDDLAKIAIGWYLGKNGGMMGNTAKMLGIFGLRNAIAQVMGGALGGGQNSNW